MRETFRMYMTLRLILCRIQIWTLPSSQSCYLFPTTFLLLQSYQPSSLSSNFKHHFLVYRNVSDRANALQNGQAIWTFGNGNTDSPRLPVLDRRNKQTGPAYLTTRKMNNNKKGNRLKPLMNNQKQFSSFSF